MASSAASAAVAEFIAKTALSATCWIDTSVLRHMQVVTVETGKDAADVDMTSAAPTAVVDIPLVKQVRVQVPLSVGTVGDAAWFIVRHVWSSFGRTTPCPVTQQPLILNEDGAELALTESLFNMVLAGWLRVDTPMKWFIVGNPDAARALHTTALASLQPWQQLVECPLWAMSAPPPVALDFLGQEVDDEEGLSKPAAAPAPTTDADWRTSQMLTDEL